MEKIVVADFVQMLRVEGEFSKEHTKVLNPDCKVTESYVKQINEQSAHSGRMYVINKEKTNENNSQREDQIEQRKSADKVRAAAGSAMAHTFLAVAENATKNAEDAASTEKVKKEKTKEN